MKPTPFECAGGEAGVRAALEAFYDRVFDDVLIGFFFAGKDRNRIIEAELSLVRGALGGGGAYVGRPLRALHERIPILGGHFERRRKLLADTLAERGMPEDVVAAWLHHTDTLRSEITPDAGSECDPGAAQARILLDRPRRP